MAKNKITVGITDCSKWVNYAKWIEQVPGVTVLKLSQKAKNICDLEKCDGILLTGGEDVHPKFYNKPEYFSILDPKEVDVERDEFEMEVIKKSLSLKKPVLGICRGLQIANVYFGGTLIPDIPSAGKPSHSKFQGYDKRHLVNIFDDSVLKDFIGKGRGPVNSAHHQSADVIASDLRVTALSDDGIVEGLEWLNPEGRSFLLLVQWHPERMTDADSPFSKNIRDRFISELQGF